MLRADDEQYQVFPPRPSNIEQIKGAAWGWDAEGEDKDEPPVPQWNPRTGFSHIASDEDAAARRTSSGASASSSSVGQGRRAAAAEVSASLLLTPSAEEALPFAPRGQVLSSCIGTGFWMTALALFLRQYAQVRRIRGSSITSQLNLIRAASEKELLIRVPLPLRRTVSAGQRS